MFPVRIYLRPTARMDGCLGFFSLSDDQESGIICVRDSLDTDLLVETVIEEWSHARTAFLYDQQDTNDPDHHPSFWAEYGRIIKASREQAF